jgi:glycosyltransferase involved in cell wall biosynthesis
MVRRLDRERFETELFFLHDAGAVGRELFGQGFGGCERLMSTGTTAARCRDWSYAYGRFDPTSSCLDHHDAMTLGRLAGLAAGVAPWWWRRTPPAWWVASTRSGSLTACLLMEIHQARRGGFVGTRALSPSAHEGIERDRIAVIENGVDLSAWPLGSRDEKKAARAELGIDPERPMVLMVAAMRLRRRRTKRLLGAVAHLKENGRRVLAVLAGDGATRSASRRWRTRSEFARTWRS